MKIQIKHPETNEPMYQVIKLDSNQLHPYIQINTLSECKKLYQQFTEEQDDDKWFVKKGSEKIYPDGTAECSMIVNQKGWGFDYMRVVILKEVYMNV